MSTMLIHAHRHRRSHFPLCRHQRHCRHCNFEGIDAIASLPCHCQSSLNDIIDIAVSTMLKRHRYCCYNFPFVTFVDILDFLVWKDIIIGEILDIGVLNSVHLMTTIKLKHRSLVIPRLPKNTLLHESLKPIQQFRRR